MARDHRDPTSFFDAAPLSPSECQMLSDIGKGAFSKLLETTRFIRRLASHEAGEISKHAYGATINITGSLEEIAHFCVRIVSSGDSAAHRKIAAQLYCLETTARLHVIEMPSSHSPFHYSGLRWSHVKSPMRMLMRDRDFCTIEYLDEYIDENGKRGFAMCSHSVSHTSCPPLTISNNFVRASVVNSGYVFTETDMPSVLRLTIYFDYNAPGGIGQARLLQSLTKRRVKRMHDIHSLIGNHAPVNHLNLSQENDQCAICNRNFKGGIAIFQRKVQCRLCDQIVCRRCSDEEKGGYMRDRVCHSCLRDMHPAFGGFRRPHHEGSSVMSAIYSNTHSHSQHDAMDSQRSPHHYNLEAQHNHFGPPSIISKPSPRSTNLNFNRFQPPGKSTITPNFIDLDGMSRAQRAVSIELPRTDSRLRTPSNERGSIFDRKPSTDGLTEQQRFDRQNRTPRRMNEGSGFVTTPRKTEMNTAAPQVFTPKASIQVAPITPKSSVQATPITPRSTPIVTAVPITPRAAPLDSAVLVPNRNHKSDSLCDLSYLNDFMRGTSTASPNDESTKSRKSTRSSNQSGHSTASAKSNASARSDSSGRQMSDLSYLSNYKQ